MNITPKAKVWRLMVFGVPDRLAAAVTRLGFRPTQKNPSNFWRTFNPQTKGARKTARNTLATLNDAGLANRRWDQVEAIDTSKQSFGYTNFAQHNRTPGAYRLKQRRK